MNPRRGHVSKEEFIKQIRTRAVLFGKPRVEREGNVVSCVFFHRGAQLRGAITFPTKYLADGFEARLKALYPMNEANPGEN
jgi:hypothetical protein